MIEIHPDAAPWSNAHALVIDSSSSAVRLMLVLEKGPEQDNPAQGKGDTNNQQHTLVVSHWDSPQ